MECSGEEVSFCLLSLAHLGPKRQLDSHAKRTVLNHSNAARPRRLLHRAGASLWGKIYLPSDGCVSVTSSTP